MASEKREIKNVYRVSIKERNELGHRIELERYDYETGIGAIRKYEELVMEYDSRNADKKLLIELQFITEGKFFSIREKHFWDGFSHELY